MLGDSNASPVLATKDLVKATEFYTSVLGLTEKNTNDYQVVLNSGNGTVELYESDYAGTNQATAATWEVDDIETFVTDLKGKGVTFEHYDLPGTTLDGDIHTMGDERAVWFKDPDGNILCLHSTV